MAAGVQAESKGEPRILLFGVYPIEVHMYLHQKKFIRTFMHRSIIQTSQNLVTIQMTIGNKMET